MIFIENEWLVKVEKLHSVPIPAVKKELEEGENLQELGEVENIHRFQQQSQWYYRNDSNMAVQKFQEPMDVLSVP